MYMALHSTGIESVMLPIVSLYNRMRAVMHCTAQDTVRSFWVHRPGPTASLHVKATLLHAGANS